MLTFDKQGRAALPITNGRGFEAVHIGHGFNPGQVRFDLPANVRQRGFLVLDIAVLRDLFDELEAQAALPS